MMFLDVSSRALTTTISSETYSMHEKNYIRIVNPGRIKTTPADDMEL